VSAATDGLAAACRFENDVLKATIEGVAAVQGSKRMLDGLFLYSLIQFIREGKNKG
jgi:hypothetical protein